MSSVSLPINFFDLLLLGVLIAGVWQGRKQGMSEELLSLLKWLCIVGCGALAYEPLGRSFAATSRTFGLLTWYIVGYIVAALLIVAAFALLKQRIGGKLLGSDLFGRAEYYLGMGSGLVRFSCMLVAALAILNARAYDAAEIRAMKQFQDREFGSEYFLTWQSIQASVFKTSLTGPWIRGQLGFLLIEPTKPVSKKFKQREYTLP